MHQQNIQVLFSDYFQVAPELIEKYGAFNISLLSDLPLFIDPFLLFNSKTPQYQILHEEIIKYLRFLKEKSGTGHVEEGLLKEWYEFKEVKQNWLGFSTTKNQGHGLGPIFAKSLNRNLHNVFTNFGLEKITAGSHLERLVLIKDGVGKDNISDFTVNLIKEFLLEYTETFTKKYISSNLSKKFIVDKVIFNYTTESWERREFLLPNNNNDFVLLTPKDILTKDEGWINKGDLVKDFNFLPNAISDVGLRSQINNYFRKIIPEKPNTKEEKEAILKTIEEFPVLLDYYIKRKEKHGDQATNISKQKIALSQTLYVEQFKELVNLLSKETPFYSTLENTYKETKSRVDYFKQVVEKNDGYKLFYVNDIPIKTEDDLQILFRFVWYGTNSDVNREVNNGRGPVDYKISNGAKDKTLVEFKLARNNQLKKNLQNQLKIYREANDTNSAFCVILYFTANELEKVNKILNELDLNQSEHVVLVDARNDNKISASKA